MRSEKLPKKHGWKGIRRLSLKLVKRGKNWRRGCGACGHAKGQFVLSWVIKNPDSIGGKRGPERKKAKSYGRAAKVLKMKAELNITTGGIKT